MFTETKKVLALVALIVTTGIAAIEVNRGAAQADPMLVAGGAAGYAGSRIDVAFQVAAAIPAIAPVSVPMAEKGDLLPIGCAGPFRADVQAECIDTAYEVESGPYFVMETRGVDSSILTRMMGWTVADVEDATKTQ